MDFESPDVAKEFPGLAIGLPDTPEYDDGEKGKKKKKDSKKEKDKDKGYATLAGESSPDEENDVGDSKSPSKVKKMKSFSLSSTKKKDSKKSSEKAEKKSIEKLKEKEKKLSTKEKLEKNKSVDVEREVLRRPFDGSSHRKSTPAVFLSNSPITSTKATTSSSSLPKSSEKVSTPSKGLNVFLNAPLPMLLLKKKDKESKKDSSAPTSTAAKVKLKLKRGSKASLDETSVTAAALAPEPPLTPSRQLPEEPEVIVKEIRKYEALLEQTHSQFKAGKKMSKKHEEQLWELQRTLTQLKRKLRSVNALSASFTPSSSSQTSSSTAAVSTNPYVSSSDSEKSVTKSTIQYQPVTSAVVVAAAGIHPTIPIPQDENTHLDFTPRTVPEVLEEEEVTSPKSSVAIESVVSTSIPEIQATAAVVAVPEVPILKSISKAVETEEVISETKEAKPATLHPVESPEDAGDEIIEKFQVQVEVHFPINLTANEHPTPEDIYEKEIESFDIIGASSKVSPLEKRQNVDIIKGVKKLALNIDDTTPVATLTSKSEPTLGINAKDEQQHQRLNHAFDRDDATEQVIGSDDDYEVEDSSGDYVLLRVGGGDPLRSEDEQMKKVSPQPKHIPAFKVIQAPSIFDPFSLPLFKTDEFLMVENELLIAFNSQLQNDIVREEEEIEELSQKIQQLAVLSKQSVEPLVSDLNDMDDDELVNVWQVVKFENDTLNEQVQNLRTMVASSRLEEFRLETRLKYFQDYLVSSRSTMDRQDQDHEEESESHSIPEG